MTNNLNNVFNIASNTSLTVSNTSMTTSNNKPTAFDVSEKEMMQDYRDTRTDFDVIMSQGKAALEEILTLASSSQNARYFEAATDMVKALAETNALRLDVHEKIFKIRKLKAELGIKAPVATEKVIFVGSTSDLLNQIKPREKIIDVEAKEIEYEEI